MEQRTKTVLGTIFTLAFVLGIVLFIKGKAKSKSLNNTRSLDPEVEDKALSDTPWPTAKPKLVTTPKTANSSPVRDLWVMAVSTSAASASMAAGSKSSAPKQNPLMMKIAVNKAASPWPSVYKPRLVPMAITMPVAKACCLLVREASHLQYGTPQKALMK